MTEDQFYAQEARIQSQKLDVIQLHALAAHKRFERLKSTDIVFRINNTAFSALDSRLNAFMAQMKQWSALQLDFLRVLVQHLTPAAPVPTSPSTTSAPHDADLLRDSRTTVDQLRLMMQSAMDEACRLKAQSDEKVHAALAELETVRREKDIELQEAQREYLRLVWDDSLFILC